MEDQNEFPSQRPEIDFQIVVDALKKADTPFPAKLLYRFSDLQGADLEQLSALWPELDPTRRERLLEDLELLAESNYLVSFEAVCKLGLSDSSSRVRQLAIRALWESDNPGLAPLFLDILDNDPNLETRAQAANGLGKFLLLGEMEEIPRELHQIIQNRLFELYQGSFPEMLRRRALEGLGYSSDKKVGKLIEEAISKDNDEWTISALIAMGRSAHQQWIPSVIENLSHSDNLVRLRAVQAAGDLSAEKAVEHLIERLQDPDDDIRMAAVWSLSEIGGIEARDAIEALLETTEDEDELDLIEDALENLEFTDVDEDLTLFDLEEEDLEDMIHPEEDEDSIT